MKNRSKEEIDGALQSFSDVFHDLMGRELTKELVIEVITELLRDKERDMVKQRFHDFSPKNLRDVIKSVLREPEPEPEFFMIEEKIEKSKRAKKKG